MRILIWTWRVVLLVVVGSFIATVYYMTHTVGTDMDSAMPALNLITAIGSGVLGVAWTVARRYWHALILLASLGLLRGLFADELLTEFQGIWVLVSIGVVGLVFVVTLTARALINDRALKAAKATTMAPVPVQSLTPPSAKTEAAEPAPPPTPAAEADETK